MYRSWNAPKREDCPNCGAEEGAIMGSSEFNHSISCCSEKCGQAIHDKIEKNTSTPEYEKAVKKLEKAKDKVYDLKYKGINACDPFDNI